METIKLKSRVNAEGKLILQLPQNLANQELEIVLIYEVIEAETDELGYPVDFLENTAGVIQDDSFFPERT